MSRYHDPNICIKCGEENITKINNSLDGHIVLEYTTVCKECNYKGYWVTGFFVVEPDEDF